jgi:hypothetical protein
VPHDVQFAHAVTTAFIVGRSLNGI